MKKNLIPFAILCILSAPGTALADVVYCPASFTCDASGCNVPAGWATVSLPQSLDSEKLYSWNQAIALVSEVPNRFTISCLYTDPVQSNILVAIAPQNELLTPNTGYSNGWTELSYPPGLTCIKDRPAENEMDCPFQ